MARAPVYPGSIPKRYDVGNRTLQPRIDKLVLHSTETTGLPGYDSGRTAPNLTVDPWAMRTWQHFDSVARSAKTLRDTGGFAENRDNVSQIELVGYSDAANGKKYGKNLRTLPDDGLRYVATIVAWYHVEHGVPLVIPAAWPAYPASYGAHKHRMTTAEFDAYRGVLGHLHVPDNAHGDPTIDIGRVMELARQIVAGPTTITEEDDMPLSDDDLKRVYEAVWFGRPGAPLIPRVMEGGGEWPATSIGALTDRITRQQIAPLRGEIAGLSQALGQLAGGQAIDLDAIREAARQGVADAVASVETTIIVRNAEEATR